MSVLRNLESKLAGLVEGTFSRAFKSEVRPVEIARKLAREMDEHRVQSLSRTYAPNEYAVWLSPDDRAQFEIVVRMPEGRSVASTEVIGERVARIVREVPEVVATLVTIGDDTSIGSETQRPFALGLAQVAVHGGGGEPIPFVPAVISVSASTLAPLDARVGERAPGTRRQRVLQVEQALLVMLNVHDRPRGEFASRRVQATC